MAQLALAHKCHTIQGQKVFYLSFFLSTNKNKQVLFYVPYLVSLKALFGCFALKNMVNVFPLLLLTAKLKIVVSGGFLYACILVVPSANQQSLPHFGWTTLGVCKSKYECFVLCFQSHLHWLTWKEQVITCKISSEYKSVHTDVASLTERRRFTHILRSCLLHLFLRSCAAWLSKWYCAKEYSVAVRLAFA